MSQPRTRTVRIEFSVRSILSVIGIALSLWLIVQIWQVFLIVVIALVLAAALTPVVQGLERRRMKRAVALAVVFAALVLAVVGLGVLIVPALFQQVSDLITQAPQIQQGLADTLATVPAFANYAEVVRQMQGEQYLEQASQYALASMRAAVEIVALGLTTVVLAFYIIADREHVRGFVYSFIPRRFHVRTARILLDLETVVGGYVRGQAVTSVVIFAFTYVLLTLVGAPNGLAIAIFAALANLIPFVGTLLATIPAVLAALTQGVWPAVMVLAACMVYELFEGKFLIPRVCGQTMRLSPVAVTIALLVGGTLLGILGALLALPLAAGLRVIAEDLRIELPGDQTGERAERVLDERAEELYARHADGTPAIEAAAVAAAVVEHVHEQEQEPAAPTVTEAAVEERDDAVVNTVQSS
jgi:predicted PurR-regulated permease PerM